MKNGKKTKITSCMTAARKRWLNLPDENVANLDSALCSKRDRRQFIELLASSESVLQSNAQEQRFLSKYNKLEDMLCWVRLRGFRLSGVVVGIANATTSHERTQWIRCEMPRMYGVDYMQILTAILLSSPAVQRIEVIPSIYEPWLALVAAHCPQLQHLEITSHDPGVCDVSFLLLCRGCPLLEHLHLGHCLDLTEEGLLAGLALIPKLRFLQHYPSVALHPSTLSAVGQRCPKLQMFRTFCSVPCSDSTVLQYARSFPRLTSIGAVTSEMQFIPLSGAAYLDVFHLCPHITTFEVPIFLPAEDAKRVLGVHKQLTHLSVSGDHSYDIFGVIAQCCPQLLQLSVHLPAASEVQSYHMIDAALLPVATACCQLRALTFTGFGTMTADGVVEFAQKCPSLRQLTLICHNDALDVPALPRVAQLVPRLFIKAPKFAVPKYDIWC